MRRWGRSGARDDEGEQSSALEFQSVDDTEDTYFWRILDAESAVVGGMRVLVDDECVRTGVGFASTSVVNDAVVTQIQAELERVANEHPDRPATINVQDPLVRHRLRAAGYVGGLRERLRMGTPTGVIVDPLDELRALLPHLRIVTELDSRHALRFEVSADDVEGALEVGMPRRSMFVEEVAACLDTVFALKRALAPVADRVHRVFFGDSRWGEPPAERWAGVAQGDGRFTVDGNQVFVDDVLELRRTSRPPGRPVRNPARVPLPHTAVDGIAAHEVWHLVDGDIVGSGRDYVAFHHALGVPLGVETLEAALRARRENAEPEMKRAMLRLALQVSPYATTNRREATAEMFKMWWCSDGEHRPVVARFGELVEERLGHPLHPNPVCASA